jgi:hypothetical protein
MTTPDLPLGYALVGFSQHAGYDSVVLAVHTGEDSEWSCWWYNEKTDLLYSGLHAEGAEGGREYVILDYRKRVSAALSVTMAKLQTQAVEEACTTQRRMNNE